MEKPNHPLRPLATFFLIATLLPWVSQMLPYTFKLPWIDWICPVLLGLGGFFLKEGRHFEPVNLRQGRFWLWMGVAVLVVAVLQAPLIVGYRTGRSYFTYGSEQWGEFRWKFYFLIVPATAVSVVMFEWALRRKMWRILERRLDSWVVCLLTSAAGTLVALPRLYLASGAEDPVYFWAALGELVLFECLLSLFVLRSGFVLPGMVLKTALQLVGFYLLGDILSPYLAVLNYSSSSPLFYGFRVGVTGAVVGTLVLAGYFLKPPVEEKSILR
ncbi:MAG: hypothetical protein SFY92_11245 [Verrucomicrobiae bacterium]|nr:hypothetical protein [Verrucomicrobiae bacterium]